jgi:hypothetical protein
MLIVLSTISWALDPGPTPHVTSSPNPHNTPGGGHLLETEEGRVSKGSGLRS